MLIPSIRTARGRQRRERSVDAPSVSRCGFTLVEVMVAAFILTIGVYILSSTVTSAVSHALVQQERSLAIEATGNLVEELHAVPFGEAFALYNGVGYDDPEGNATAPGNTFQVEGLEPIVAADGTVLPVGQVLMPSSTGVLREDMTLEELGMPRDLDGDLVIDDVDHSRDYMVLPVIVRVSWESRVGPRSFQMQTMLAELGKL